jgi:hypothetical protein
METSPEATGMRHENPGLAPSARRESEAEPLFRELLESIEQRAPGRKCRARNEELLES